MNDKNPQLLPSGLYDLLPPDAHKESNTVVRLLTTFASFGYAQVNPPLMEFETSLLAGRGAALAAQTFRVMDPLSREMMGVRADMTLQVARIAASRMATAPRPLRLCYAGQIVQTKPDALQNERQLTQVGIELIGSESLHADAEVMMIASEALSTLGIQGISIDINLPGLLGTLCPEAKNNPVLQTSIRDAVSQRDSASIKRLSVKQAALIAEIIETAGIAEKSLQTLEKLKLPEAVALRSVIARLQQNCPAFNITIDPLEYRGFDYHQGISFSLFAKGLRHELGRGGRYQVDGETATGFTIYVTHLLDLLPMPPEAKRIMLPQDVPANAAKKLREEGWVTIGAMTQDVISEAKTLGISAIARNDKL